MKKFEMPEVQVITFDEDIMVLDIISGPDAGTAVGGADGDFTTPGEFL